MKHYSELPKCTDGILPQCEVNENFHIHCDKCLAHYAIDGGRIHPKTDKTWTKHKCLNLFGTPEKMFERLYRDEYEKHGVWEDVK